MRIKKFTYRKGEHGDQHFVEVNNKIIKMFTARTDEKCKAWIEKKNREDIFDVSQD